MGNPAASLRVEASYSAPKLSSGLATLCLSPSEGVPKVALHQPGTRMGIIKPKVKIFPAVLDLWACKAFLVWQHSHSCMWSSHALLLCDLENDVSWWLCTDKFYKQTLLLIASQDSSFQLTRLFIKTKLSCLSIQYLIWTILGLICMLSIFMRAKGNLGFTSFKTNFTLIAGGLDMCGFNMFKSINFPFRSLSTVKTHPLAITGFLDSGS